MTDMRTQRLADVLVNYCTEVKPGDWVGILGDVTALPILREVFAAVVRAGGNPSLMLSDETLARTFLREASAEQMTWLDPMQTLYYDQADVYIRVGSSANTRAMTTIDPKRMQQFAAARRPWLDKRLTRAAEGTMRWVGSWYPNPASAQEASLSLEEYEDFVYGATFCDRADPIAAWRELGALLQGKADWLKGKRSVVCRGPNIDLKLSIADRVFLKDDGHVNMPGGEVYTGPVEDSVEGWVRFSYPSIVSGRAVSGIELRFVGGRVVEASAKENEALLLAQLDTDAGSRYLGEFAIGTNFGIDRFTSNILFDEKIGGTIHLAIGNSYPQTGGRNRSAVHWDMICDMRTDSTITIDGELFYQNGQFVV